MTISTGPNPYESPREGEVIAATVVDSNWEGRVLTYQRSIESLVAFNVDFQRRSGTLRWYAIVRYLIALALVPPFAFWVARSTVIPPTGDFQDTILNTMMVVGYCLIVGIGIFRSIRIWKFGPSSMASKALITRMYADPGNANLFGSRQLQIAATHLTESSELVESRYKIQGLLRIALDHKYLFIYITAMSAIIVPRDTFAAPEDCESFIEFVAKHSGAPVIRS